MKFNLILISLVVCFIVLLTSIFVQFKGDWICCIIFGILTGTLTTQLAEYKDKDPEIEPWMDEID